MLFSCPVPGKWRQCGYVSQCVGMLMECMGCFPLDLGGLCGSLRAVSPLSLQLLMGWCAMSCAPVTAAGDQGQTSACPASVSSGGGPA